MASQSLWWEEVIWVSATSKQRGFDAEDPLQKHPARRLHVGSCDRRRDGTVFGKDYLQYCAECHGAEGRGAQPEKRAVPGYVSVDLTQISKRNGGEFPRQKVYDEIEGRQRIAAHFHGDMPRWGTRYHLDEKDQSQAAQRMRDRISAMVDFIELMQEK